MLAPFSLIFSKKRVAQWVKALDYIGEIACSCSTCVAHLGSVTQPCYEALGDLWFE